MRGLASIYQADSMIDATKVATDATEGGVIEDIEVENVVQLSHNIKVTRKY